MELRLPQYVDRSFVPGIFLLSAGRMPDPAQGFRRNTKVGSDHVLRKTLEKMRVCLSQLFIPFFRIETYRRMHPLGVGDG